uniref:Pyridoxamine 5'-phosphate oxidase family protein n=1 Tax=uncultured marine thaumarchaeote KM3_82_C03 TaxID=1456303 RepID=A0A075HWV1_9ARCH|nr:pyridoxamine 5'-phosphate oxidase family protein [uncultured marine thaumarchaeote KM3_82_C03]
MRDVLEQFSEQKYINLETYKRDNTPIKTPVWFVIDKGLVYIITRESTGKVKRLKNNQNVRIVPCSFKGEIKSEWVNGKAQKIMGSEADKVIKIRKKKYGFAVRLSGLFTSQKGNLVVYSIELTS